MPRQERVLSLFSGIGGWGACIVENLRSQRVLQKAGLKFAETTTKYLEMRNITTIKRRNIDTVDVV